MWKLWILAKIRLIWPIFESMNLIFFLPFFCTMYRKWSKQIILFNPLQVFFSAFQEREGGGGVKKNPMIFAKKFTLLIRVFFMRFYWSKSNGSWLCLSRRCHWLHWRRIVFVSLKKYKIKLILTQARLALHLRVCKKNKKAT